MKFRMLVFSARSSLAPRVLFLMCLLAAFARTAMANPVAIQDSSFDTRSLATGGLSTTLTPWLETGGTANGNGWIERVSGFAADGQNHLAMNLNHNVWQDLGVTYQSNTRYTLTVAVGNRSGFTQAANQSRYILAASDGTVFATGTLNASTLPVGTFADAPALVFETGSRSAAIGKTLRILLQSGGSGRSHFDKILLTAVSTNPPIVTTGAATALTQTGATLNGTVNPLGQTATVAFSYGLTNAYGSTASATAASLSGTSGTAVTARLSGLEANTVYHYRLAVTAGGVTTHGSDATFTTAQPAVLSLTPSTVSIAVPSGESASGNLTVENNGPGAGEWSLEVVDANGREDNMGGVLTAIADSGSAINGPLPFRFDFSEGETGTAISSGGGTSGTSVFSTGNQLSTSLGGPVAYSDGVVSTAASLGTGGSYFTKKLPGLFIFGADLNGPSWFEVNGYLTYATGSRQTSEFSITRNGRRWSAFVAKTPDYWRTINHLILVDQGGLTATTGTSVNDQKHRISGLTGKRKLFHLLYVSSTTAMQPDSVFEDLAGRLLDVIPMPLGSVFAAVPSSGIADAGGNSPITLTANAMGISPGTYPFQLRGRSGSGTVFGTAQGTLEVTAPRLSVPSDIFRAGPIGLAPFVVDVPLTGTGPTALSWAATLPGSPGWLALDTPSGTTPSPLKLRFTPGSLAPGNYSTTLRVTADGAVFEIPVRLSVTPLSIRKFLPDPLRPVVYAVNQNGKDPGEVLEISTVSKSITRSVRVGKEPSDLDLTENGNQLVVMNTSGPSLSVVDLASFSVTETIPLTEFSNRNDDVGGHVKCGKGPIVYYVDEQWGPRLRVFDTATKTVLQTFSADNGTSPNTDNNNGYGDINLTPDRSFLFGWVQYGDGAGWAGTGVARFSVGGDGRLSGFARSADYYQSSGNFVRDPFDTPVLLSRDGSRLVIKGRVVERNNLDVHPISYPDEIYSLSPGAEIAVGSTAIYAGEGGEILHNLAVTTTVQTVLPDYSALVYFNSSTKSLGWLDLPATLGLTRLGLELAPAAGATVAQPSRLKWLPVTGITRYQVYLGTNRSEVENATTSSALYLGLANGNEMTLAGGLAVGQTYYWRVVPVDAGDAPVGGGSVYSFSVSSMTFSRSSIAAETVQGVTTHVETIQLESAVPQSWTATESTAWIKSVSAGGTTPGALTIEMDASGLAAGIYQGSVTVTSGGSQVAVPVSLRVYAANFVIADADLDLPYVYLVSQADVSSTQPSFLLRLNTATDKIESAIPCGSGVTDLAVHYLENRIYLTNWKTGVLRAYDRSTFAQVQTYQFTPVGPTGYGEGGIHRISAGKAGRLIIEESDQWIDIRLINTANGAVLASKSSEYAGDGEADPLGRYYYHSEMLSSSDSLTRYDLSADTFAPLQPTGNASAGTVVMIPDGSRIAVGPKVFDPGLVLQFTLPANVLAATLHGDLLFTGNKAYNGVTGLEMATLPANTTVMSVSGDQKKLYQFPANSATFQTVALSTIAPLPSRSLTPAIADGATVIGTTQELGWSIEPVALSYDVYFGTSAAAVASATKTSPEFLGNTSGSRWTGAMPPLGLASNYFWRVDVAAFSGTAKGNVWSFRVAPLGIEPGKLSVVLPANAPAQTLDLQVGGPAGGTWTVSESTSWLTLPSSGGAVPGVQKATINPAGMAAGIHNGSVRFQSGGDVWDLPVSLEVIALNYTHATADLDRSRIYAISQPGSGTDDRAFLVVFDTATNQVVKVVPAGRSVTSLSVHYQENRLYVTNWASGVLRALDRDTLEEVRTYQFAPAGATGYGNGDAYVVAAGRSGRIMVEEEDQWIDSWLVDTATGNKLATFSSREGGGLFEPTGRYYFHGENNSSGAVIGKHDTNGDKITMVTSKRVESFSYYGSRYVAMSGDGSRVFWNGGVFDPDLNVLMQLKEEVVTSTYRGELLFTNTKAVNGSNSQTLATLPVDTKIQAVSGDQRKLFLFKNAAVSVVDIATIANVPPRGLIPGIADKAVVIGTSQELTWSQEAAALSYDVYFGNSAAAVSAATKDSPEFLGNVTGTRWTGSLPNLSLGGEYFWRVDLNGFSSVSKGSTWSFGIASVDVAPRAVKLAAPAGSPVPTQNLAMTAGAPTAWTASTTTPWITLRSTSGTTSGSLQFDINTTGQSVGTKSGSITLQAAGKSFTVPVELSVVTLNVTKLITHPNRPVVYAINTSLAGEGFCHLLEINPATAVIQRTLPIGFAPTDADLDPIGERLYVSNWGYSQTRVIDVAAWAELPSLNLGEDIYKLEVTPKGRLVTEGEDQWISLRLWNAATGASLTSASSVREGDGQADPTGNFYYHCDNNSSGAILRKYDIAADTFVQTVAGPQIGYGSRNLILSGDGKRLFWLGRAFDENLTMLATMPSNAEVHATNHSGELAIGESAVWWSDSGTQLATLPFAGTVATVSSNDAYLVRFNATTRTLHSTAVASLTDLPGPWPRPGQILNESPQRLSWTPVDGAISYRVYIAADATALQAMTTPTATVNTAFYDLPAPLAFGRSYTWRVDAVKDSGVVTGKVQSFTIRFPQGPQLALPMTNSGALAVSLAQGKLLLGWGSSSSGAQVFGFDAATGSTSAIQSFAMSGYYGDHYFGSSVAVDQGKAFVGAYARDNPSDGGGNVFAYRPGTGGYWEQTDTLAPPVPVAAESFGKGIAAAGNLMLAGTGNTYSLTGRVAAYLTEPAVVQTQVFSASDGSAGDGFGSVIAMDGNRAIISAPGRGSSYNRIPCLYAFTRSTTTGLWTQTQKISIPGATSSSSSGNALALSGTTMAVRVSSNAVAVFTESGANQWTHSVSLNSSAVTGASSSFGVSLALHGDQLFIGDSGATYQGTSGGAVFSFRRNGAAWVPGPVITPAADRSSFGRGIAVREGWLVVAGDTDSRPASVYRIEQSANRIPWFTDGAPSQLVAGRAFSIPLTAADADGNAGLAITKLQGPSWFSLTDQGDGAGVLSGTPVGASGSTHDAQFEVRDGKGGRSLWTTRITLLSENDLPTLVQGPVGADLGVGREFVLRAAVSGIGPFKWQWYHDGKAIPGATRDTFIIGDVKDSDAGRYQVRVSNVVGELASSEVVLTVHPSNRYGGDWPTFGGSPAHTGRHPAALEETHFLPAWTKTIPNSTRLHRAAVAAGRVHIVSTSTQLQTFSLETGELLWTFDIPPGGSHNPPTVHDGRVYFQRGNHGGDTQLFALDAITGAQIWKSSFSAQWESYEAPAVSEAGIFINGGYYGGMYGFNFDGSERFFHNLAQYDDWTPTLANGRLFSWVAGGFIEHNPYDGSVLWSLDTGWDWSGWSMNTVSAVSGNSAALISTTDLICVDLPTRSIRWRVPASYRGSPGIADGRVFAIQGNAVRSYSLANGAPGVVYQTDASSTALIEQPVLFNDRLVISNETKTWVFNLEDGVLLQTLNAGGRLSYANGYLLAAGNDGVLRAFAALNYNPKLASLALSSGGFLPEFDSLTTRYIATVPFDTDTVTITPTTQYPAATVKINGVPDANGSASRQLALNVGENEIQTLVTAEDGITTMTYTMVVTRLPQNFVFNSNTDIPLTANGFLTGGYPVNVILNHHPAPGTALTMVNNTGPGFIHGRFGNLAHGQRITLQHAGVAYDFVANYHGGSGNDLVLQWADNMAVAWGQNNQGQLGDASTENRTSPVVVEEAQEGVFIGKTIFAMSAGYLHSLALLHDGTIASWGYNVQGQLGLGHQNASHLAVRVDRTGALAGKTVVAIAAGAFHNLALCDDGTIVSWGLNTHGQLGTGDRQMQTAPVRIEPLGALAGKRVVAVAAGFYHSLALCDDGTVVGWGYNDEGELGDGGSQTALVPVAVDVTGALAGKSVTRIAAGQYHSLALCKDGTLVAWGYNARGQLGDGTTTDRHSPALVDLTGIAAGGAVQNIAAGGSHSLARLADGTLAGWGDNARGQLDPAVGSRLSVPQILAASPGRGFSAGAQHTLSERTAEIIDTWGDLRAATSAEIMLTGDVFTGVTRFVSASTSAVAFHNLAIVAQPTQVGVPVGGLAEWREQQFGSAANEGMAEDCEDCDHDGIPNLVEYAFQLDPHQNSAGEVPQPQRVGDRFELRFSRTQQAPDIEYGAEWSPDLQPGSWRDIPDSGDGGEHVFSLPVDTAPSLFMRLRVRTSHPQ